MKDAEKYWVKIDAEMKDLIPPFIENRHKDVSEISAALKKNDFESIARAGHDMKGSGMGFGFEFISEIGAKIEKAGKAQDAGAISECLGELSHYLKHLEISYE